MLAAPSGEDILDMILILLHGCVKGIEGADMMGNSCKPEVKAFDLVLQRCSADPYHTAVVEDSVKIFRTAMELAWQQRL